MSVSILSIASIIAAFVIAATAIFLSLNATKKIKDELSAIKNLIVQVSNGTFDGDNPPPQIKESADILTALKQMANDVQHNQQAVSHFAYTDELTGLPNGRRFNEELIRSFDFAKRGLPVCIVSMEIENLKEIISEAGRSTSDKVVKLLAKTLSDTIRKTDFAARLGNDDFAIVLPNMENDKIHGWLTNLSEKLVDEQKNKQLLPDNDSCHLRFGYSFVNQDTDEEPQQVLDRAIQALAKIGSNSSTVLMED
ncbi:MAG: GGDEF domain-containing protein [Gammaproteobacteria bacterium]|nr:GGDEF domain-containing protein [Gammaproteobacteria bacterium]